MYCYVFTLPSISMKNYALAYHVSSLLIIMLLVVGCASSNYPQRSEQHTVFSDAMGKDMSYSVYTPPGWSPEESLPLMVLLHGAMDNHKSFDKFEVGLFLDEEIAKRTIPRIVILFPDGELGFWENWQDGTKRYRDWVIRDLMPQVQQNYNTGTCPESCFISGVSMGAHGAMRFAYYEPDTFHSVSALSALIISKRFPGKQTIGRKIMKWLIPVNRIWGDIKANNPNIPKDLDPYTSWVDRDDLIEMPLLLAWGNDDSHSIEQGNQHFHQYLEDHGKAHEILIYEGGHKWKDWRLIIDDAIRFHTQQSSNAFFEASSLHTN